MVWSSFELLTAWTGLFIDLLLTVLGLWRRSVSGFLSVVWSSFELLTYLDRAIYRPAAHCVRAMETVSFRVSLCGLV